VSPAPYGRVAGPVDQRSLKRAQGVSVPVSSTFPFSPMSLSPALWLDATDLSTITESSGAVSEWRDKVRSRPFTQATAANQPTYESNGINGLASVKFDGTTDFLQGDASPSTILSGAVGATMFLVAKLSADPPTVQGKTGTPYGWWGSPSGSGDNDHYPFTDGNVYTQWARTNRVNSGNPALSLATTRTVVFTSTASAYNIFIDGGTAHFTTATSTFGLNSTNLQIGRSSTSGSSLTFLFDGLLGELIVYPRVLTRPQINTVARYLVGVWGTSWTLI
jgi:hypothetical protein